MNLVLIVAGTGDGKFGGLVPRASAPVVQEMFRGAKFLLADPGRQADDRMLLREADASRDTHNEGRSGLHRHQPVVRVFEAGDCSGLPGLRCQVDKVRVVAQIAVSFLQLW